MVLMNSQIIQIVYFYGSNGATSTKYPDGIEILEFPTGQKEINHLDGRKEIEFPDGLKEVTHKNGKRETFYPNGSQKVLQPNGDEIIYFKDGQKVKLRNPTYGQFGRGNCVGVTVTFRKSEQKNIADVNYLTVQLKQYLTIRI